MLTAEEKNIGGASVAMIEATIGPSVLTDSYAVIGSPIDTAGMKSYRINSVAANQSGDFQPFFANDKDFADEKAGSAVTATTTTPGAASGTPTYRYMRIKAKNTSAGQVSTLTVYVYLY